MVSLTAPLPCCCAKKKTVDRLAVILKNRKKREEKEKNCPQLHLEQNVAFLFINAGYFGVSGLYKKICFLFFN